MNNMRQIHALKIRSKYFASVMTGKKTFELRNNDRDFKVGDDVILKEIDDAGNLTGAQKCVRIKYLLKDCPEYGLADGYCIFCWE